VSDDPTIELRHQTDYRFVVDFDHGKSTTVLTDLGPPLGAGAGPDAEKLIASAVATCLSSSLLFALKKYGNEAPPIRTRATPVLVRNEQKRLRVGRIDVEIDLGVPAESLKSLERTLATFEDFCVVTQSVRAAIPVNVRVVDGDGVVLATPPAAP